MIKLQKSPLTDDLFATLVFQSETIVKIFLKKSFTKNTWKFSESY